MEVELTLILFTGLKHFKLLIFDFLRKLHSRPELWAFEHGWINNPLDGYPLCLTTAWILELQLSWVLHNKVMRLGQTRFMRIWTWIEEIQPEGSNLKEMVWQLPSLHGHSSALRVQLTWIFFWGKCIQSSYGRLKMDWQKVSKKQFETNLTGTLFEQS